MDAAKIIKEREGHAAFAKLIAIDGELELSNGQHLEFIRAKEPQSDSQSKILVLILPGGGYEFTTFKGCRPVALAFAKHGFDAAVLRYTTKYNQDVAASGQGVGLTPLIEVATAISELRSKKEWGFSEHKIAVCGFSAGGHLAASSVTLFKDEELLAAVKPQASIRPDAAILAYPLLTTSYPYTHDECFFNLTSSHDKAKWLRFSCEQNVSVDTPPCFIFHSVQDRLVPYQNSLLFAQAMWAKGCIAALKLFPQGAHGCSLATPEVVPSGDFHLADSYVALWLDDACAFLRRYIV